MRLEPIEPPGQRERLVTFERVSKVYSLYEDPADQVLDTLGLRALMPWLKPLKEYRALSDLSFGINRGERLAIVGRNGAGKSTTLRLMSGGIAPSAGHLTVNGRISALLELGLGFHLEMSGRDNIRAALAYNDLKRGEFEEMFADVVDFCELGDFLDYPVKVYSAGMRMRLFFGVATAVKPDILVIDEVLGAGDAYFGERSFRRMKRLTDAGSALVLVSHNLGQIADMCDRAIWIEGGVLVADGPCREILEMYMDFAADLQDRSAMAAAASPEPADRWIRRWFARREEVAPTPRALTPAALPVSMQARILDRDGVETRRIRAHAPLQCRISMQWGKNVAGKRVSPEVALFSADGRLVSEYVASEVELDESGETDIGLVFSAFGGGPGEYLVAGGVSEESAGGARRYIGLLDRSQRFQVLVDDVTETSLVLQPATWSLEEGKEGGYRWNNIDA